MNASLQGEPLLRPWELLREQLARLARTASLEINVHDAGLLRASRAFLSPGQSVHVSHLPQQTWQATVATCQQVREAGFNPVPHLPVRLLPDARTLESVLADFTGAAGVRELLLISGDYPTAMGPYTQVAQVMRTGLLQGAGIRRLCVAGHPEGHPKVASGEIWRAQLEKAELAARAGLELTLLTQFFFEAEPFLAWTAALRAAGVRCRLVGGLAGPTKLGSLIKYAMRCGVGPSVRALSARPASFARLLADHGPEGVLRRLAQAQLNGSSDFAGIHLFCFGGYLRTCQWLQAIAQGRFELDDSHGFKV
jgi:methylenetetrahydrofolate reductase (NADPH)